MLEKKFLRSGNSWCIIIPTSVLKMLGINPDKDSMQLVLDGDNIVMKPIKNSADNN